MLACTTVRLAPPGEPGAGEESRFVQLRTPRGLELVVTGRHWSTPPQHLLIRHSALWVEVVNHGSGVQRVAPGDFTLRHRGRASRALEPGRLVREGVPGSTEEARLLRAEGFRGATLGPGEGMHGFLFFREKFRLADASSDERPQLLLTLHDVEGNALEPVEVFLELAR